MNDSIGRSGNQSLERSAGLASLEQSHDAKDRDSNLGGERFPETHGH